MHRRNVAMVAARIGWRAGYSARSTGARGQGFLVSQQGKAPLSHMNKHLFSPPSCSRSCIFILFTPTTILRTTKYIVPQPLSRLLSSTSLCPQGKNSESVLVCTPSLAESFCRFSHAFGVLQSRVQTSSSTFSEIRACQLTFQGT
jgi:hypothetical protein